MGRWRKTTALALAAAAAVAASSHADTFGGANVRAKFTGWVTPRALPREVARPIALHLRGSLSTTDGRLPPQLRRLEIAINRLGRVSTVGLPTCRRREIEASTTRSAMDRCGDALVGRGHFTAHIEVPTQAPFPARGQMLAFNARERGRRVIVAHIYGTDPVPTSQVLTLRFGRRESGTYGTTMSVEMPVVAEDWGHVTGFRLDLERRYTYRGRERSLLSARCPAPEGTRSVAFSAAKGTYHLADGRELSRIVVGRCRVAR
jgi:hypothetical protein